jgi:hypothetical protein
MLTCTEHGTDSLCMLTCTEHGTDSLCMLTHVTSTEHIVLYSHVVYTCKVYRVSRHKLYKFLLFV